MQIHGLVALHLGISLGEPRAAALNLDTATCFALYVLHIGSTMSNDLGTKVETRNRLQVNGNTFLWPFALCCDEKGVDRQAPAANSHDHAHLYPLAAAAARAHVAESAFRPPSWAVLAS